MYQVMTPERFTEIYEASYLDVLRFVRRRAHPLLVDDVVAETFTTAWRRRDALPDEPRAWLFRTAMNLMMNAQRGERRQLDVATRLGEVEDVASDDLDGRLDLASAWRRLAPIDQQALALRAWDDLTAKEAAEVLGITRAGYAMRLGRARRRLAALMTEPAAVEAAPAR